MSVYRKHGSDNYFIDITLKDVGRLVISSESRLKADARSREALLKRLRRGGQLDVLLAVKDGRVSIGQLVQAERAKRLDDDSLMVDVSLDAPFAPSFTTHFTKLARKRPKTAQRYLVSLLWLSRVQPISTVRDLAYVDWDDLRDAHRGAGRSAADWNHLRRMLSRGLTLHLGDPHHRFRRDVLRHIELAKEPPGRLHALSLPMFVEILAHIPVVLRPSYMTLLITGMRCITEYLRCGRQHLREDMQCVAVPGTKTAGSEALIAVSPDLWPWIDLGIPAAVSYAVIVKHFHRAAVAAGYGRYVPTGITKQVRVPGRRGYPTTPGVAPEYRTIEAVRYHGPRVHDIRHLSIALAFEGGAAVNEARAHGRHARSSMTLDYARLALSRHAAAAIAKTVNGLQGEVSYDPAEGARRERHAAGVGLGSTARV